MREGILVTQMMGTLYHSVFVYNVFCPLAHTRNVNGSSSSGMSRKSILNTL